jgi:hypothetical protein
MDVEPTCQPINKRKKKRRADIFITYNKIYLIHVFICST